MCLIDFFEVSFNNVLSKYLVFYLFSNGKVFENYKVYERYMVLLFCGISFGFNVGIIFLIIKCIETVCWGGEGGTGVFVFYVRRFFG